MNFEEIFRNFSVKCLVLETLKPHLFINGRNLGDQEQRQHTSFVKDFAPAPGRRIEIVVRFQF